MLFRSRVQRLDQGQFLVGHFGVRHVQRAKNPGRIVFGAVSRYKRALVEKLCTHRAAEAPEGVKSFPSLRNGALLRGNPSERQARQEREQKHGPDAELESAAHSGIVSRQISWSLIEYNKPAATAARHRAGLFPKPSGRSWSLTGRFIRGTEVRLPQALRRSVLHDQIGRAHV